MAFFLDVQGFRFLKVPMTILEIDWVSAWNRELKIEREIMPTKTTLRAFWMIWRFESTYVELIHTNAV